VRFPITARLLEEAERYQLRSACRDCFFFVRRAGEAEPRCAHEWPDRGQGRWPLDAPDADGAVPTEAAFCKEFELA
jgi:hypothetical protein